MLFGCQNTSKPHIAFFFPQSFFYLLFFLLLFPCKIILLVCSFFFFSFQNSPFQNIFTNMDFKYFFFVKWKFFLPNNASSRLQRYWGLSLFMYFLCRKSIFFSQSSFTFSTVQLVTFFAFSIYEDIIARLCIS